MAPLFDTHVQQMKYIVLSEVAKLAFDGELTAVKLMELPKKIIPDGKPMFRCCIFKERAIIGERISLALSGGEKDADVIAVLPIACDECPVDGIQVTDACRGCLAHRCKENCPKDAISIVNHRAVIDKEKCVECGRCLSVCPYSAIVKRDRPCISACKAKAIQINSSTQKATIDRDKCINCGACVYQCPFGAISDTSSITQVISLLQESKNNTQYHVYAVIAPAIASQYGKVSPEQVIGAIQALGFYEVVEAARGADMVAYEEAKELSEKGFLLSSCCPSFVEYAKKFPQAASYISGNLSPMACISKWIKEQDPLARVVFIGPCIAKKAEVAATRAGDYVDYALTFEEMQALFAAKSIDVTAAEKTASGNASYYGRIFAKSGGLTAAVQQALKEQGFEQFAVQPAICNGIAECRTVLHKIKKGQLRENFVEGMACEGGCIGGPACLSHTVRNASQVDTYAQSAAMQSITESVLPLRGDA